MVSDVWMRSESVPDLSGQSSTSSTGVTKGRKPTRSNVRNTESVYNFGSFSNDHIG